MRNGVLQHLIGYSCDLAECCLGVAAFGAMVIVVLTPAKRCFQGQKYKPASAPVLTVRCYDWAGVSLGNRCHVCAPEQVWICSYFVEEVG